MNKIHEKYQSVVIIMMQKKKNKKGWNMNKQVKNSI